MEKNRFASNKELVAKDLLWDVVVPGPLSQKIMEKDEYLNGKRKVMDEEFYFCIDC